MVESDRSLRWLTSSARCRLCGSFELELVFDMGKQVIGSYFPASVDDVLPSAPLCLVRCQDCTLVQLSDGPDHADIYATGHYGYRSGLNPAMVRHLSEKAAHLTAIAGLVPGDVVLDIASNDGTFLGAFAPAFRRYGIDPTGAQFREHLPAGVTFLDQLFSADRFRSMTSAKARLITSLAMLYDLDDPRAFARDVAECLTEDGIWHFEQCYLPTMLAANSFDTICHEHLTYYTVETIELLLAGVGMRILDVELNDVNGGSLAVTACKIGQHGDRGVVEVGTEAHAGELSRFAIRSKAIRDELSNLVHTLNFVGDRVGAIGASTKGNTLLQYCGFGPSDIVAVGEINEDKVGRFTPGSSIPIVAERDVLDCDYLLVLPWHFRDGITPRMSKYLDDGGRLIYPLPEIEVVTKRSSRLARSAA